MQEEKPQMIPSACRKCQRVVMWTMEDIKDFFPSVMRQITPQSYFELIGGCPACGKPKKEQYTVEFFFVK